MKAFRKLAATAVIAATTLGAATGIASADSRMFVAHLYGGNEIPGPGDANAFGMATVVLIPGGLCYSIILADAVAATSAQLQFGPAGAPGGAPIVALPVPGGSPTRVGNCIGAAAATLAMIRANPQNFHVNVRNAAFPAGAARGQLQ